MNAREDYPLLAWMAEALITTETALAGADLELMERAERLAIEAISRKATR